MQSPLKILMLCFVPLDEEAKAGSALLPLEMIKAFRGLGHDLTVLGSPKIKHVHRKGAGLLREFANAFYRYQQGRARRIEILAMEAEHALESFDFCYVEAPSGPLLSKADLRLIERLHRAGVPVGLFYPDAYWAFPEMMYGKNPSLLKRLKQWVLRRRAQRDLQVFRQNCRYLYVPSLSFAKALKHPSPKALWPACDLTGLVDRAIPAPKARRHFFYIGAITERYGVPMLFEACQILIDEGLNFQLSLVTHEAEWLLYKEAHAEQIAALAPVLTVKHLSHGAELDALCREAEVGLLPILRTAYNIQAMPVKLFQSMAYQHALLSTPLDSLLESDQMAETILFAEDHATAFAQGMRELIHNTDLLHTLRVKSDKQRQQHRWEDRAQTVIKDLTALRAHSSGWKSQAQGPSR